MESVFFFFLDAEMIPQFKNKRKRIPTKWSEQIRDPSDVTPLHRQTMRATTGTHTSLKTSFMFHWVWLSRRITAAILENKVTHTHTHAGRQPRSLEFVYISIPAQTLKDCSVLFTSWPTRTEVSVKFYSVIKRPQRNRLFQMFAWKSSKQKVKALAVQNKNTVTP